MLKYIIFSLIGFLGICEASRQTTMLPGTVKNFELPNFNEENGYKEWDLFGSKAVYISDNDIDLNDIKLVLYSGDENIETKATISSPLAKLDAINKTIKSKDKIKVISQNFELNGQEWQWRADDKVVDILNGVDLIIDSEENEKTYVKSKSAKLNHANDENIFKFLEDVKVSSDDMELTSDELKVVVNKEDENATREILAKGNVKMLKDNKDITCHEMLLDPNSDVATLNGNPKIIDTESKAAIMGHSMQLDKNKNELKVSSKNKQKAVSIFLHTQNSKEQTITIQADEIVMLTKKELNEFNFIGEVKVISAEFTIKCDNLIAFAHNTQDKPKIDSIKGYGNVVFDNGTAKAYSQEMIALPEKSEVWLIKDAKLEQNSNVIMANSLLFLKDENKAMAFNDPKDEKSVVITNIAEDIKHDKTSSNTKIISKTLTFEDDKKTNEMIFNFEGSVNIKNDKSNIDCQKLKVIADTKDGKSKVKEIIAENDVVLTQENYEAKSEYVRMFSKIENTKEQNIVELRTLENQPDKRPKIILPALGNIGLNDPNTAKETKEQKTVIESDLQYYVPNDDEDKYYFEDNVKISGTDLSASSKKLEVTFKSSPKDKQKHITHVVLSEDVKLTQGLKDVSCGRADIHADDEIVVLSQNPVVVNREDDSRVKGYRIIYNKGIEKLSVESDPKDAYKPKRATITLPTTK